MTLAYMRHNGVRALWVVWAVCRHEAVLNVDAYADEVVVPSFGPAWSASAAASSALTCDRIETSKTICAAAKTMD